MTYLLGEQVQLGLGVEHTRGTAVAPQAWIPARTPSGITAVVERVDIKETRGTGISSEGSEIVQIRAEGDLEFNVRHSTIGYIFLSLLGGYDKDTALGATTHTFTRQTEGATNPALTLMLAQPGQQHYRYPLGIVSSLEIKTPVDDLVNAKVAFIAQKEEEHGDYSPSFSDEDYVFRNQDVTLKFADNVAGLSAATGACIKEFSLTIANNGKPNQCIGKLNPTDILSLVTEISGTFVANYDGPATFYDTFKDGSYKAMQIILERTDLDNLGTSVLKPKIQITLAKVSFSGYKPTRPIDDIVTESIDFKAHYDEDEASAIEVVIQNTQADYDSESGS
jgi:hypothetical protein